MQIKINSNYSLKFIEFGFIWFLFNNELELELKLNSKGIKSGNFY